MFAEEEAITSLERTLSLFLMFQDEVLRAHRKYLRMQRGVLAKLMPHIDRDCPQSDVFHVRSDELKQEGTGIPCAVNPSLLWRVEFAER